MKSCDRNAAVIADGDSCWLIVLGKAVSRPVTSRVHALRRRLEELNPGWLRETVPGYCTLGLVTRSPVTQDIVEDTVQAALTGCGHDAGPAPRTVTVPVCYGGTCGPDLDDVARHAGISAEEVIRRHAARTCDCTALGFLPGFPYLTGLDPLLATPRRAMPRTSVPGGSVGIAGTQTGIYPASSPGGWNIIGRTPLALFDPSAQPPARIEPGDRVRFVPVTSEEFNRLAENPPEPRSSEAVSPVHGARVIEPGLLTTVQDRGRWGMQAQGVPVSGAMDPHALAIGNILVGNDPGCAALEITLAGPTLLMDTDAVVALTGADMAFAVNGIPVPSWTAVAVRAGDTVSTGTAAGAGCRAWLCFAGSVDVPAVLGSRSTLLQGAFGGIDGRALRAGDALPLSAPSPAARALDRFSCPAALRPDLDPGLSIPVVPGPQQGSLTATEQKVFVDSAWVVSADSDRMGCRLEGPSLRMYGGADVISEVVPPGSVEITGSGSPIVMLADHQTTGGYVKPFVVATAALGRMAQLVPGDHVHFQTCTLTDALGMLARQKADRERLLSLRDAWQRRGPCGMLHLCVNGDLHVVEWQDITETEGDDGTDNRSQQ
jgi:KipI family sensor histidine kinase inhibitor